MLSFPTSWAKADTCCFPRYNVETNLWQEIRASGRAPPARSGAQDGNSQSFSYQTALIRGCYRFVVHKSKLLQSNSFLFLVVEKFQSCLIFEAVAVLVFFLLSEWYPSWIILG